MYSYLYFKNDFEAALISSIKSPKRSLSVSRVIPNIAQPPNLPAAALLPGLGSARAGGEVGAGEKSPLLRLRRISLRTGQALLGAAAKCTPRESPGAAGRGSGVRQRQKWALTPGDRSDGG